MPVTMYCARVVELVDTRDLKSLGGLLRAGSTPAPGTIRASTNKNKLGVTSSLAKDYRAAAREYKVNLW